MLTVLRTTSPLLLLAVLLLLLSACVTLAACGSSKSKIPSAQSSTPAKTSASSTTATEPTRPKSELAIPASASPSEVVATVAGKPITLAVVWHQMALNNRPSHEVPDAPGFAACTAHQRSVKGSPGASDEAQLKEECRKRYLALLERALINLIHSQWLIDETAEAGLEPNRAELAQEVKENLAQRETIKRMGLSVADVKSELRLGQLSNRLYERVRAKTPHVTDALVSSYYQAHKKLFDLPEQRDLHIIRTLSESAALQVRHEVQSGKSFAQVVKKIALPQPIKTKEGLLRGLTPKFFSEPVLSEAIFRARPHVLSNPVKIELGYYVFEVTKVAPPHQLSLAQVKATIEAKLPGELHEHILNAAVIAFKKKWTARSSCRAGYVVSGCKELKLTRAQQKASETDLQDAYTF